MAKADQMKIKAIKGLGFEVKGSTYYACLISETLYVNYRFLLVQYKLLFEPCNPA